MLRSTLLSLLCLLAVAPSAAQAGVTVNGTGENAYTNTTSNRHFFAWTGTGSYRLEVSMYDNNALRQSSTYPVAANGTTWVDWSGVQDTLQEGHLYTVCVTGQWYDGSVWYPDGVNSCSSGANTGKRSSTTIDLTDPTLTISAAAGAATTKSASIPVSIGFSDNLAGPGPATFLCVIEGPASGCGTVGTFAYDAACSVPGSAGKTTTFGCTLDLAAKPDGQHSVCAIGADAAVPDKPENPNQSQPLTKANLSAPVCTSVTLDRAAPTLTAGVADPDITTAEQASFTAQAGDATSGLDGTTSWAFGDGATGTGDTPKHTYTTPGTYTATATAKDTAGNVATKEVTVRVTTPPAVEQPPAGNGNGGGSGNGNGTPPAQQPTGAGGAPGAPGADGAPGAPGGSSAPPATAARLDVAAARTVKAGKALKSLALSLTADTAGSASIALVRGGTIVARGTVALASGATKGFRLKLPKGLKPGGYALKVSFTATGATRAQTQSLKLTVKGKASSRNAKARKALSSTDSHDLVAG